MTEDHFNDEDKGGHAMKGSPQSVDAFAEAYRDLINNTLVPVFPKDFDPSAFHSGGFIKPRGPEEIPALLPRTERFTMGIHYPLVDRIPDSKVIIAVVDGVDAIDPEVERLVREAIGKRYDTEVLKIIASPPEMSSVLPEFGGRPIPEFETPRWGNPASDPVADLADFVSQVMDDNGKFKPGCGWFDPDVREKLWNRIDASVRRRTMSKRAYRRWRARQRRIK